MEREPASRAKSCLRCRDKKLSCDRVRPSCDRCRSTHAHCQWEISLPRLLLSPAREEYSAELGSYMAVYELFPMFHPYVLETIYKSVWGQEKTERCYSFVILDAMSSLISLYMAEDKTIALAYYESANERLNLIRRVSLEGFMARTILVRSSLDYIAWCNANM